MKLLSLVASVVLVLHFSANEARSRQPSAPQRLPIIDMHVHATGWDHFGSPPPPNPKTGKVPTSRTDQEFMHATLAELKRYNIVKAVAGGPREHVLRWYAADSARIIGGTMMGPKFPLPDVRVLTEDFRAGRLAVLAELGLQYAGVAPNDLQMEPYWTLAERLDIPVGLHTGLAPPRTPYQCCPEFRVSLGNPALLEDVLIRHPKMRVYLMHAGFPFLQETIAIMHMYPQVYADLAVLNWSRPAEEFQEYLRALMRSGFGKRLMFGSDQQIWPEAIGMAIEGIESATFLTAEQKRDIFYNNAVRFLRLDENTLERQPK